MRVGERRNDHGVLVAEYVCATCGNEFSVTPAPENDDNWENCLGVGCKSYNTDRDVNWMFPEDPKVTPIRGPHRLPT